jgi:hypothetical protein
LCAEDKGSEPEVREDEVQRRIVEFVGRSEGEDEGGNPEAEDKGGLVRTISGVRGVWGLVTYNAHLEDEMLIMREVVQEVPSDTDDNGGAEPCHGVAADDGKTKGLGGEHRGNHVDEEVVGSYCAKDCLRRW